MEIPTAEEANKITIENRERDYLISFKQYKKEVLEGIHDSMENGNTYWYDVYHGGYWREGDPLFSEFINELEGLGYMVRCSYKESELSSVRKLSGIRIEWSKK
jgi:hypothetical protein